MNLIERGVLHEGFFRNAGALFGGRDNFGWAYDLLMGPTNINNHCLCRRPCSSDCVFHLELQALGQHELQKPLTVCPFSFAGRCCSVNAYEPQS